MALNEWKYFSIVIIGLFFCIFVNAVSEPVKRTSKFEAFNVKEDSEAYNSNNDGQSENGQNSFSRSYFAYKNRFSQKSQSSSSESSSYKNYKVDDSSKSSSKSQSRFAKGRGEDNTEEPIEDSSDFFDLSDVGDYLNQFGHSVFNIINENTEILDVLRNGNWKVGWKGTLSSLFNREKEVPSDDPKEHQATRKKRNEDNKPTKGKKSKSSSSSSSSARSGSSSSTSSTSDDGGDVLRSIKEQLGKVTRGAKKVREVVLTSTQRFNQRYSDFSGKIFDQFISNVKYESTVSLQPNEDKSDIDVTLDISISNANPKNADSSSDDDQTQTKPSPVPDPQPVEVNSQKNVQVPNVLPTVGAPNGLFPEPELKSPSSPNIPDEEPTYIPQESPNSNSEPLSTVVDCLQEIIKSGDLNLNTLANNPGDIALSCKTEECRKCLLWIYVASSKEKSVPEQQI